MVENSNDKFQILEAIAIIFVIIGVLYFMITGEDLTSVKNSFSNKTTGNIFFIAFGASALLTVRKVIVTLFSENY